MAVELHCILLTNSLLLISRDEAEGKEVAVLFGGYPDPFQSGSQYSETEFFTEREDSCIHTEQFSNISTIFDHSWDLIQSNSMTLMGVYVENHGIFACPGDCVQLGSSRQHDSAWQSLPCRARALYSTLFGGWARC